MGLSGASKGGRLNLVKLMISKGEMNLFAYDLFECLEYSLKYGHKEVSQHLFSELLSTPRCSWCIY